jgi:hypothetical protein
MAVGILKGIGKGLGSLLRRSKGRGPNRKLTPEEVAQRRASEAVPLSPTQMGNAMGSTAMRAKQVGDETMGMIRDSIMKMDLPAAKKVEAIKSAATAIRNATPAQLAEANPAQLSMNIIKMVGAGGVGFIGGSMMEGAAREGRLPGMIQDSYLVRPEFRGMRDTGDAVGKMLDATQMPLGGEYKGEDDGYFQLGPQFGNYDKPDPEPGLQDFSFLSPGENMLSELFNEIQSRKERKEKNAELSKEIQRSREKTKQFNEWYTTQKDKTYMDRIPFDQWLAQKERD